MPLLLSHNNFYWQILVKKKSLVRTPTTGFKDVIDQLLTFKLKIKTLKMSSHRNKIILVATLAAANFLLWQNIRQSRRVDFNTQIKPIFNQKCIVCHGGVKQSGGFNLLTRELALQPTESGKLAIVPTKPDQSELLRRIRHHDPAERMPYREKPLENSEIELLERWIQQGAEWGRHWAYEPVQQPAVPRPTSSIWGFFGNVFGKKPVENQWFRNEIDHFVFEKLKEEKLSPAAEADRPTLLRRLALDLTGLPAPQNLQEKFLADSSETAYQNLVDSLLASPSFGERWASVWLDLARYADSKGYEKDGRRLVWRYRDWLIRSFNSDMPYDQFLVEQLAGDLLPQATDAQRIATTFHRNTPTNDEGGTDNEEYRVAAVLDRTNTTWEAVLGSTFACVQCHSHPYDPFFHEEYYQFAAFFNNSRDADTYDDFPLLRIYAGEDSLKFLKLKNWLSQLHSSDDFKSSDEFLNIAKLWQPARYSIETDSQKNCVLLDTKWLGMNHNSSARLPQVLLDGKSRLLLRFQNYEPGGRLKICLDRAGGAVLLEVFLKEKQENLIIEKFDFQKVVGKHDLFLTYENPRLLKKPDAFGVRLDWLIFTPDFPGEGLPERVEMEKTWFDLLTGGCETLPVMFENPSDFRRKNYLFERGNWLVHGQEVQPATPRNLPPMRPEFEKNRLGMARWLVLPEHPLTSRVVVNRLWEQIFGQGLVETVEDFGSQGIAPSHPELLDWLAWRLVHEHRWSLKKLLRDLVLSATYRQSSEVAAEKFALDPANRWLGRGAKIRLSAEQIRDQALAVSGLLSKKMFGKPVMPAQPDKIWQTPYNSDAWKQSLGEDQYRRSIYTFWKRSSPYPSALTFDGAARQVCTARRVRTNTPLQALVTLNDPVFVECAQNFALRMAGDSVGVILSHPDTAIKTGYWLATGRGISAEKLAVLLDVFEKSSDDFRRRGAAATSDFLKFLYEENHSPEVAGLSVVANVILNLDEVLTKN